MSRPNQHFDEDALQTARTPRTGVGEVLVVDDTPASLKLLSDLLVQAGYTVRVAPNGELALWSISNALPELILLDVRMPGIDGYEVCRRIKANPESAGIPVIFLSAQSDTDDKLAGFNAGAIDYISKPYSAEEVLARVRTHVNLVQVTEQLELERQSLEQKVQDRTLDLELANTCLREEIDARTLIENRLRLVSTYFDTSFDSIFITDVRGTIVATNPAFTLLMGYSAEEAIGHNANILNSGKHDRHFFSAMWNAIFSEGKWSGEIWNRRKDGNVFPCLHAITACRDEQGEISHFIGVFMDVSEQRDTQLMLSFLTHHDALTGLPNRATAGEHFKRLQSDAEQNDGGICVMCLDIDRFRNVNDLLGHAFGDRLLQMVTGRLKACLGESDLLFRQGADEFVILHRSFAGVDSVLALVDAIKSAISTEFVDDDKKISISMSIGIAVYPDDGKSLSDLLSNAGSALALTQAQDGGNHVFFKAQMEAQTRSRFDIEMRLRHALENHEFEVYYQPQVSFHTGKIVGAEALLRWKTSDIGYISPALFIPVAEQTGRIIDIGLWVMHAVCRQMRGWQDSGIKHLKVAINLSGQQFRSAHLSKSMVDIIHLHGADPSGLEFEITESAIIGDIAAGIITLQELKSIGASISLDDFGTGYSNLNYLKKFPIDYLKIDQSFVKDLGVDHDSDAVLLSIIALAHNLRLKVVAEGVETKAQLDYLKANGCDILQGYYFSKPIPAEQFYAKVVADEGLN